MIIQNGTIEVQSSTGGGLNTTTGFPRVATPSWGDPIPCQFSPVKVNRLAQSQGEPVVEKSFTILIEEQPQEFEAERVRLKTGTGRVVGEFSIISAEPLEAVGQVKITV